MAPGCHSGQPTPHLSIGGSNTTKNCAHVTIIYRILQGTEPCHAELLCKNATPRPRGAGRQSNKTINGTNTLLESFHSAQSALRSCIVVTLPRPSDTLWIVTDGAVKEGGMGATLYILRHDQLLLAGFFSARLHKHQVTWLPCEVEALSIAMAVNHFAPYIIQAAERTHVLTDSRPCVLAYNKLCRGEFSNSMRVTSFLSTASWYQVVIGHIAGSANLPSDYASRHPVACQDSNCQVCTFVSDLETSVVRTLSVTDVTDGTVSMPFTNRPAWVDTKRLS